ncbi:hypothetical protein MNEG_3847 [Monoraphidium neglectum]|uniref:Uncharacterized protein n=1 Tax=Monoraphidium neglectum TaxID=145388 RepID=A0A0D2MUB9_9CHLO|nr:hypothetical protein MNEG_3847 [Monoraphidium neglectum]KIZ04107.1 hypothetical protein MNEG_3847 [Monoraphidium neglectum]|eukprot:XP_013903126.1 hypothetical protein MNEG_3847 [Monoraphidium neglectum]
MLAQKTAVRAPAKQGAQVVAAKVAATAVAVMVTASPAFAGVILEQPTLKKVFQAEASAPAAPKAAKAAAGTPAAPAAPKPKKQEVVESSSGGISPQSVALPAALVVVGGGAFALSSLDAGFSEFMRTAAVKDSGDLGAGYETAIKAEGGLIKARKGTTKVKKAKK